MSGLTTFLFGAVIGGGAKWAYDVCQREDTSSEINVNSIGERLAERANNLRTRLNNPRGITSDSVVESTPAADTASELEVVHGIGPVFSNTLVDAGITTLNQLAEQSVESIVAILDAADLLRPANVESWPEQAASFANA